MDLQQIVSLNIKKERSKMGITQEELAFLTGLHRTYVSQVERNLRNLSIKNIEIFAHAFKISPYELLIYIEKEEVNDEKSIG